MKTGIELIAIERQEQIEKHGRTVTKDKKENDHNQLLMAVKFLITPVIGVYERINPPYNWDENIWLKMINKPHKERLIIAGALIAAELDRINNL